MKTSVINGLVLLGLLASEQPVEGQGTTAKEYANLIEDTSINSCSKQESCIKIHTYEYQSASPICEEYSDCGSFKICLELDFNDENCAKGKQPIEGQTFPGVNSIDYTCLPMKDGMNNHICNATSVGNWRDKARKRLGSNKQLCQFVAPGHYATFVFNDGGVCRDTGDDVASGTLSFSNSTSSPLSGVECAASTTANCCYKLDNDQQYCDNNIGKDCVWKIPAPSC